MPTADVPTTLTVRPQDFDRIREIIDETCMQLRNTSTPDGYIVDVYPEATRILDNRITHATGALHVDVVFSVDRFIPTAGLVVRATLHSIFPEGIFFSYGFLILVPTVNLPPDAEISRTSVWLSSGELFIGDEVDVVLTKTRYDQGTFQCIGRLAGGA
jgi:DNA-directed RNA polymerase subunit E'/Rpb7